jgi:hypothetical protein
LSFALPAIAAPVLSIDLEATPAGGNLYDVKIYATVQNAVGGIASLQVDIYSPDTASVAYPNCDPSTSVPTVWSSGVTSGGFSTVAASRRDLSISLDPDTDLDDARGCSILDLGSVSNHYFGTNSSYVPVKTLIATEKWVVNGTASLYAYVKPSSSQSSAQYYNVANSNAIVNFGLSDVVVGNVVVPEPITLVILSVGGLGLLRRRA